MTVVNMDLDGVLFDFNGAMADRLRLTSRFEPTKWHWWDEVGMTEGEWNGVFRRGVERYDLWGSCEPYPDVAHQMWRLSDAGVFVRIVTTRLVHPGLHHQAVAQTAEALERRNIPYRALAFERDKEVFAQYGHYLFDDRPENIQAFLRKGGRAVLCDRPWNRDYPAFLARMGLELFVDTVIDRHERRARSDVL